MTNKTNICLSYRISHFILSLTPITCPVLHSELIKLHTHTCRSWGWRSTLSVRHSWEHVKAEVSVSYENVRKHENTSVRHSSRNNPNQAGGLKLGPSSTSVRFACQHRFSTLVCKHVYERTVDEKPSRRSPVLVMLLSKNQYRSALHPDAWTKSSLEITKVLSSEEASVHAGISRYHCQTDHKSTYDWPNRDHLRYTYVASQGEIKSHASVQTSEGGCYVKVIRPGMNVKGSQMEDHTVKMKD